MTARREPLLGVLLAGGRSQRMGGRDKSLTPLAGRPLLAHAIERLRPQVDDLIINANGDSDRFRQFGLPVAPDTIAGFPGPLAGILAGMLWARLNKPDVRNVVTAATDTPFLPRDLVSRLSSALTERNTVAVACSHSREHPVFGLFPVSLADDLAAFLAERENHAVKAWIDRQAVVRVDFTAEGNADPFFNVNTPADLLAAEAMLGGPDEQAPVR